MKNVRIRTRLLSILLLAAMLVTMPQMSVWARTVPGNPSYDGQHLPWDYIYFGSYPQSEVTDPSSEIVDAEYSPTGDAWVNGIKYRRIRKLDTTNDSNFGNQNFRYFKWERLKWQVLQNEGDTLLIQTYAAVDCQQYNKSYSGATWSKCTLRTWLNEDFYNTAFSARERGDIVESSVDNSNYNEGATKDNVFILSRNEVSKSEYGYNAGITVESSLRRIPPTDYTYYMGADMRDDDNEYADGFCWWWLRDPGDGVTYKAGLVNPYGQATWYVAVNNETNTVVPVLRIKTASKYWNDVDDETSGDGGETLEQKITYNTSKIDEKGKIVYGTSPFSLKAATDGDGKLTYKSSDKAVVTVSSAGKVTVKGYGAATITVTAAATGSYKKATLKIKVTVVPKKAKMKSPKPSGQNIVLSWESDKTVSGYQYSYATDKDFSDEKKVDAKTATSATLKSLRKGTKYYVRVRSYKKVGSKTYYGEWSNNYYFTVPK